MRNNNETAEKEALQIYVIDQRRKKLSLKKVIMNCTKAFL